MNSGSGNRPLVNHVASKTRVCACAVTMKSLSGENGANCIAGMDTNQGGVPTGNCYRSYPAEPR